MVSSQLVSSISASFLWVKWESNLTTSTWMQLHPHNSPGMIRKRSLTVLTVLVYPNMNPCATAVFCCTHSTQKNKLGRKGDFLCSQRRCMVVRETFRCLNSRPGWLPIHVLTAVLYTGGCFFLFGGKGTESCFFLASIVSIYQHMCDGVYVYYIYNHIYFLLFLYIYIKIYIDSTKYINVHSLFDGICFFFL